MTAAGDEIRVREARPEDFAEIDELIVAAYAHDYGPSEERGDPMRTAAGRATDFDLWVAHDADEVLLGSITTRRPGGPPLHEDFASDELDVRLLGVSPLARRRGVGAALMARVATHAKAAGFRAVALKTAPNMAGAHRLYDALGFTRVPERDGLWIGGVRQFDLYTYVLPLE